jgi:hypothetical protein
MKRSFVFACLSCLLPIVVAACGDDENSGGFVRMPGRTSNETSETAPKENNTSLPSSGTSCSNGVKDGDETDVDCGGGTCPVCANGDACNAGPDCASRVCTANKCTNDVGCADGTREGFPTGTFPSIAACAGAWSLPGLVTTTAPACDHVAGNDSPNAAGTGCNVADLCQAGWHVCQTAAEVKTKSNDQGCAAAAITGGAFFVARQSGSGGAACGTGTNDLFGCGDVGNAPDVATCAPFDRFSFDLCTALPATWSCGTDGTAEATNVTKTAAAGGGVLCCRD